MSTDIFKRQAGEAAVEYIQSGMLVGLGTGTTAIWAVRRIGERLKEGTLKDVVGVPTSLQTEAEARRVGIPLVPTNNIGSREIDVTIDGADEITPQFDLIKGGGGALLREKITAQLSRILIIAADDSKLVPRLCTGWAIPVEVVPFGYRSHKDFFLKLRGIPTLRLDQAGDAYQTDQGNYIYDVRFPPLEDPAALADQLKRRTGVVEHGLFLGMATQVITCGPTGLRHHSPQSR